MEENKKRSLTGRKDFYVFLVMLTTAVFVKFQVNQISVAESRVLPDILFGVMVLCGIVLLVQTLQKDSADKDHKGLWFSRKELFGGLCMVACWIGIPVLGFYSSICLLIIAFMWMLEPCKCLASGLFKAVAAGALTTAVLYMCFARALHIVTPVGIWI
ncbi:MAG: tripartite tricarboxylate transporter TctB family protein [Lachnospiraceae bacterium]|nr:tripartite tricarboxylate transporter TctB family protein [Lachnospiraceae bacterium]